MDNKMKEWIDNAHYQELLSRWRFASSDSPWLQGEIGIYYEQIMKKKRAEISDEVHSTISKLVGW